MEKIVILHNSLDKASRDWISANPSSNLVIDWYSADSNKAEYYAKSLPHPSVFPAVVDTELKMIVNAPSSLQAALDAMVAAANDKTSQICAARRKRDMLLSSSDFILNSDSPASDDCKAEYVVYRQSLRDLDFSNPDTLVFPIAPIYEKK